MPVLCEDSNLQFYPASLLFTSGYDEAGMDSASTLQCDLQKPGRWEPWKPMQRNTDKKIGGKIRLKEKDIYDIIWYDML